MAYFKSKSTMLIGLKGDKGDPGTGAPVVQTTGTSEEAVMSQKAVTNEVNALKSDLSELKNLDVSTQTQVIEWTNGRIGTGVHVTNGKYYYTQKFELFKIKDIVFDSNLKITICYFNENDEFIKNGGWVTESPYVIPNVDGAYYAYIEVTQTNSAKPTEEMLNSVICTYEFSYPLLEKINEIDSVKTVYVDGVNGSNENLGTKENPLKTIMCAIEKGYKNIKVATGEYSEQISLSNVSGIRLSAISYPTYSATLHDTPMVHITGGDSKTISRGISILGCTDILVDGFWFDNVSQEPVYISNSMGVKFLNCKASNGGDRRMGFRLINTSGEFINCEAYNAHDGFNIHGYGDTTFINCIAHDCSDDGLSHHDGCTGTVIGGEFYNCVKGGISTPTHGAIVNVSNAYCHDNVKYGIYVDSNADGSEPQTKGNINGCLLKNNGLSDLFVRRAEIIAWNNTYDTKQIDDSANYTEY